MTAIWLLTMQQYSCVGVIISYPTCCPSSWSNTNVLQVTIQDRSALLV
jgi:hypothetical protein